ncbi:hypothetical protein [Halomicrococcus sp. NG-SE-24]|uniref:hypothetical protein n=1 Tax=Halomicrococcus sp. NG-SE-24 TaxID=3436928 RepID=UPI003D95FBC4
MRKKSQSMPLILRISAGLGLLLLAISSLTLAITILTTPPGTRPPSQALQAGNAAAIPALLLLLALFVFKYPPQTLTSSRA